MYLLNKIRSSLKLQIVLIIGGVITFLMMIISLGILVQWRSLIIQQQQENAQSVATAFSIPVLDALIFGEQTRTITGDLLESHIANFMKSVDDIKYISIIDDSHRIIAHSDLSLYNTLITDVTTLRLLLSKSPVSSIFHDETHGWILETVAPLQIAGKHWGAAFIGFDAEPTRRKISDLFFLLFFLTVAVTGSTIGVLYYFIDKIMSSLNELVKEVDKIDLESETPTTLRPRKDEIGFLIRRFELLKERLIQSKNQLEHAQRQIYQAEKLASIGRLASGVAHEVNNPLNGIKFCVYNIQKDPLNRQQTDEYLELINEGLQHIESVVKKLLNYARQHAKSYRPVDVNKALETVLGLLDYRFKQKNISIDLDLQENLKTIQADTQLMQEMLMNLLLNSLDAIESEGVIYINTRNLTNGNISVSIKDNGTGIPKENIKKIFDPFFTTKQPGQGTGLGLSVTYGIVESHGGTIEVSSIPHKETIFKVTLPMKASA